MVGRSASRRLDRNLARRSGPRSPLQDLTAHFARFADRLGDCLPHERRKLYERFLDAAPRLLERYDARRNVTLIHGDAHVWNVFLPRDGGDDLRLFDWDGWRIGVAAGDLAYMMALHWYPDRRRRLERRCWTATTRRCSRTA